VNVANLDLNLLVSLDALLHQRSVTRAAGQLGLSQPALSASLAKLRRHFGDELLTRVGNEYRLTPLAEQLQLQSRLALQSVHRVFSAQPAFDPASSTREFHVLLSDYGITVLGDTLATLLAETAPGARLRLTPHTPELVGRADQALLAADLMLLPRGFIDDLPSVDLYTDEWVVVVSTDNRAVGEAITVEQLQTLPWVSVYHGQTASTPAARFLRMRGIEPRVQVVTESFLTVPGLVAGSGRISMLQRRLVDLLPLASGVRVLPSPVDVGGLVEAMYWHPVYERDPEHAYLRDLVRQAAELATARVG
jgi:DNA-binding transcriptional LysR family regulator